jgi:type II secretory pathway pseudopilin PulG
MQRRTAAPQGFTLIELLIITGIRAAVAVPVYASQPGKAMAPAGACRRSRRLPLG